LSNKDDDEDANIGTMGNGSQEALAGENILDLDLRELELSDNVQSSGSLRMGDPQTLRFRQLLVALVTSGEADE
jgi:hypothetical protein